jgi:hypothetical protein
LADVIVEAQALDRMLAFFEAHPEVGAQPNGCFCRPAPTRFLSSEFHSCAQ